MQPYTVTRSCRLFHVPAYVQPLISNQCKINYCHLAEIFSYVIFLLEPFCELFLQYFWQHKLVFYYQGDASHFVCGKSNIFCNIRRCNCCFPWYCTCFKITLCLTNNFQWRILLYSRIFRYYLCNYWRT